MRLWLEISNKRNVPHSLLMWVLLRDFNSDHSDEPETATASATSKAKDGSEESYLESVQAFEKAFGLDKFEKIIADTRYKRNVSIHKEYNIPLIFNIVTRRRPIKAQVYFLIVGPADEK